MSYEIKSRGFISVSDKIISGYSSRNLFPWLILDSYKGEDQNQKFVWDYFKVLNEKLIKQLTELKDHNHLMTDAEELKIRNTLEAILNTKRVLDETSRY